MKAASAERWLRERGWRRVLRARGRFVRTYWRKPGDRREISVYHESPASPACEVYIFPEVAAPATCSWAVSPTAADLARLVGD